MELFICNNYQEKHQVSAKNLQKSTQMIIFEKSNNLKKTIINDYLWSRQIKNLWNSAQTIIFNHNKSIVK